MQKSIHVMGPPGSGKGTQADLVADYLNAIHFDSGRYFERLIKENDPLMTPELRRQFNEGELLDPRMFLELVSKRIEAIANSGFSVVFSGKPRTILETFGDENLHGFMEILSGLYGKENIIMFKLMIPEEVSIDRNSNRLVCSICKKGSIVRDAKMCSLCGGDLYKRTLDDPEVIKTRLKEYSERTEPLFKMLKEGGFNVIEIDGTPTPAEIFKNIQKHL